LEKEPEAFRTISEVGEELDVPQHVLRFWETRFSQIRPMKRGGGRRYYRVNDIDLLKGIRQLLYGKGYTIKGVQRILKERGVAHVTDIGRGDEQETSKPPAGTVRQASPVLARASDHTPPPPNATSGGSMRASAGQALGMREDKPPTVLSDIKREELELALADLAAAKRLLGSEKKS